MSGDCCSYFTDRNYYAVNCDRIGDYIDPLVHQYWNVSAEFRGCNVAGVTLTVILILSSLGHFIKPLRCFTKMFHSLVWCLIIILFITANVYRFREQGRACSLDHEKYSNLNTPTEKDWKAQALFQRRWISAFYIMGAAFAVLGCLAAVCCRKKN